jgi:hypothetical protein
MSFSLIQPDIRGVLSCGHCSHQIVLPFPTLELATEGQEWWPNTRDWLYLACPECRIVAAHIGCQNMVLLRSQTKLHEGRILIRISFLCEMGICRVPRQFHILADALVTETTESDLRALLASGYWKGVGPCVHPTGINADQKVSFDPIRGGIDLRGYNRADSFWKEF